MRRNTKNLTEHQERKAYAILEDQQNDPVRFTSLANEHPEWWYTSVNIGYEDALAKGLTFNEVKAMRQNHLEDFGPGLRCFRVVTGRLPHVDWRSIEENNIFPPTLELRGPSQLRLFLHALLKDRGGRNHTDRAQRIHRDLHRSGSRSRKDGPTQSRARLPYSSRRGKMEQPRYVSSSTSGAREATAASICPSVLSCRDFQTSPTTSSI